MVIGTAITSAPFQTNTASYCCCCWCLFTIVIDINCDLWARIVVRVLIVIAVCVYFVVLCDSNAFISTTLCCPEQVLTRRLMHSHRGDSLFTPNGSWYAFVWLKTRSLPFERQCFSIIPICSLSSDSYWQWIFCLKTCRKGLRLWLCCFFFIDMRCKYTIYTVQRSIKPLKPSFSVLFDLILRFTLRINAYQEKVFLEKLKSLSFAPFN